MKSVVPSEGITFVFKGKLYKYTGAFAPPNIDKSNIRNVKVRIGVIMGYSRDIERQNQSTTKYIRWWYTRIKEFL